MKIRKLLYLVILLALIFGGYKYISYKTSNQYKLQEVGYSKEETNIIIDKLKEEPITFLLSQEYSEKVAPIIQEKYFVEGKLEAYLSYQNKKPEMSIKDVISVVNAGADKEFYSDVKKVDTSKGNLMLVNKFNNLDEHFKFDDIVPISLQYAYNGHSIRKEVLEKFVDMWHAANKLDLTLIVNSSYRDHEFQTELYELYVSMDGVAEADLYSARPGYSEHQTGLALDLSAYGSSIDDFGQTDEFVWMKENAHKYGFILRYPEGKEHITGYGYEPWHYRYVGKEVAEKIRNLNITFDEYYELYLK
ncbi:MAG: M15 family metallopeptidase [Bacilli bacterium]